MQRLKELVDHWFESWESGEYREIPVEEDFTHSSPFGTIRGRERYLSLVEVNQQQFLGGNFEILDELYQDGTAAVRYRMNKGGHTMEVTEWFYLGGNKISRIISFYHLGPLPRYEDGFIIPVGFELE